MTEQEEARHRQNLRQAVTAIVEAIASDLMDKEEALEFVLGRVDDELESRGL